MAFVKIAKVSEIAPGTIREVQLDGKTVAVANIAGKFHGINNACMHRGGPLGQGPLEGSVVTCPWHAWQYDVTTGKGVQNNTAAVDCYPVEQRGDELFIDLP
jgi:nitrite reductase (NADH) small subunit